MRLRPSCRVAAVTGLIGILALGSVVATGTTAAADPRSAARSEAGGTVCERLEERVAQVPRIRDRIRDRIDRLTDRVAAVRGPERRARLAARVQPRIDSLRALDERLVRQVALAEARCPRTA